MGTFIKYLIYLALIVAAYFIIQGLWQGSLTKESSLEQVGASVTSGVSNTAEKVKDAVQ